MAKFTDKKSIRHIEKADLSLCSNAKSFLQSAFWGLFKSRFGWDAYAFKISLLDSTELNEEELSLLVLTRSVLKIFSLAYVPWGPCLPEHFKDKNNTLIELAISLKGMLPKNIFFIRFDPPWEKDASYPVPKTLLRAAADVQPPSTVIIDLKQGMEKILDGMKAKWRYNARLALKKGIKVREAEVREIDRFYTLLKTTSIRDGIAIHSLEYYKTLFSYTQESSKENIKVSLYLAEHEDDLLAGIVTLFRGKEAVYLYGASSDVKRNFMATYALQVKAMEDAINYGCKEYDLFGIAPDDDPNHPMAGLYKFKTGFGGKIIHKMGSYDYPYNSLLYFLFRAIELFRYKFRAFKKRR